MNKLLDDLKFVSKRPKQSMKRLLNIRDQLSYLTILSEIFIGQTYRWLLADLKPNTTAIDIGAYKGESAIYLAMSDNVKKVIAIEPSLSAYITAKKQVRLSHLDGKIELINNAVTKEGQKTSGERALDSSLYKAKIGEFGRKSIKLGELVKKAGSNRIIIKCDVEGAEAEIFDCSADALKGVYKMQIEYHDTYPALRKHLVDLGFKIRRIENHKGIFYKQVGYVLAWK
jgi:FkbM family methyltransferase